MNRNLTGYTNSELEEQVYPRPGAGKYDGGLTKRDRSYPSEKSIDSTTPSPKSKDAEEEAPQKVTKKTKEVSDYFNTLGVENGKSKLISAIIDEEIQAVDGSRVRLRLLDDIEIGNTTVKKGTYLYALMSGFGKQRVKGKVESIFFEDEILRVSLNLYDTDGLEGLYVPQSSFRETTKDIASSATQGGNLTESGTGGTGIKSWASQAMSNATQKAMSALGKGIKKNRVRLKYGTKVFLIDSSHK